MSTEDLVTLRASQLSKRPEDLEDMQRKVTNTRRRNLECFEQDHGARIVDFNFQPGALVLVRNTCVEESLNRKTKPRYLGPMVVVRKTQGKSYIVTELDGAQSQLRVAAFRVIPYFARSHSSISLVSDVPDDEDFTEDDPSDVQFFKNAVSDEQDYCRVPLPSF